MYIELVPTPEQFVEALNAGIITEAVRYQSHQLYYVIVRDEAVAMSLIMSGVAILRGGDSMYGKGNIADLAKVCIEWNTNSAGVALVKSAVEKHNKKNPTSFIKPL